MELVKRDAVVRTPADFVLIISVPRPIPRQISMVILAPA
jgi:hypothetical protein